VPKFYSEKKHISDKYSSQSAPSNKFRHLLAQIHKSETAKDDRQLARIVGTKFGEVTVFHSVTITAKHGIGVQKKGVSRNWIPFAKYISWHSEAVLFCPNRLNSD